MQYQTPNPMLTALILFLGEDDYSFAAGVRSLDSAPESTQHMDCDTVLWIASVSKLMTSVAAMSCVERGLVTLDEDISRVLPELKDIKILYSFDNLGKPVLQPSQNTITLRYECV